MLLRNIAALLLIINLIYAAYSQGWLHVITGWDAGQREPERLKKQVNSDAITVEKISGKASITDAPQIDPSVDPGTTETKESSTKRCVKSSQAPVELWVVYMGPFATQDLLASKKAELAKLGVSSTEISKSSLPRGLSLGKFKTEQQAQITLSSLQKKGIKTAKLLLWSKEAPAPKCD
jgi:cell division protein FtsN